jgi:hypothetical protein
MASSRQAGVVGLLGLGLLALLPGGADASFYLPGVAPKTYQETENVRVRGCWVDLLIFRGLIDQATHPSTATNRCRSR